MTFRECLVARKFEGKYGERKEREKEKKNKKNRLENNKLFLYISLKLFNLFFSIVLRLNNFKLHKFLINFNFI